MDWFGTLAVSSMALFYALEDRGPGYTLAFGVACLASSAYAVMIGSWPFAGAETLWAGIALRKGALRWKTAQISP